jgi:hypothetical protein
LVALAMPTISSVNQQYAAPVDVQGEQLTLLSGQSIAERHATSQGRVDAEVVGFEPAIGERPANAAQVLDLVGVDGESPGSLGDLDHPRSPPI